MVGIPLRTEISEIGSSREAALRRYHALERRFDRDPELRTKYVKGMNELMDAGQMVEANRAPHGWCYHIPHHAVQRKFRIVFDASCKTNRGLSLNEAQLVGERLQDDLFDLIIWFRTHQIGITADIRKMYLQVNVHASQWDLQRVFWRAEAASDIKEYWLTTVIFGMTSTPYCAVRAMVQCARDQQAEFPRAVRAIQKDFYMDDCITGASDVEDARDLSHQLQTALANGGFSLEKWHSNSTKAVPIAEDAELSTGMVDSS